MKPQESSAIIATYLVGRHPKTGGTFCSIVPSLPPNFTNNLKSWCAKQGMEPVGVIRVEDADKRKATGTYFNEPPRQKDILTMRDAKTIVKKKTLEMMQAEWRDYEQKLRVAKQDAKP
jgi:hypothetical protein